MSVIYGFDTPKDLLKKLHRDGYQTWIAENHQQKYDYFFNFCITAHAMRDWCIKHLNLSSVDKAAFHEELNQKTVLTYVRDIANASKHFSLDSSTSTVSGVEATQSQFAVLRSGVHSEHQEMSTKSDLVIKLSDGTSKILFEFLLHVMQEWIEVMKSKNIPYDETYLPEYMFIEFERN
ncbi:hypothetical protein ACO0LB_08465 [Undibacterium sp. SXout7W]|uniref:hypothetical protein n=1 Tax=Undibacterium sp. SXout7W TaxID=3413049 RepID=UPI003BF3288B